MLRPLALLALALPLVGCPSAPTPAADTPASESSCPSELNKCLDEENRQRCLEVEKNCPGQVLILESCPLQFSCE